MVAIAVLLEDQVPPATSEENVVVALEQTVCVPLNLPELGSCVIETVLVADSFVHPPVPITVYVIVAVPADTGVISPVVALMVAIDVLLEDHVPPVPVVVKVDVPFEQIACAPDNVPGLG